MPLRHVNDINMYYEIHGKGEPLLMIQGLGFEMSAMVTEPGKSRYIDRFTDRYQVILFDYRGIGRTDKPDIRYRSACWLTIQLVLWMLSASEKPTSWVPPWDRRSPRQSHSLPGPREGAHTRCRFHPGPSHDAGARVHYDNHPGVQGKSNRLDIPTEIPADTGVFPADGGCCEPVRYAGIAWQDLFPTLIVNGIKDSIVPMRITRELAGGIPGARLVLVDGDHLFMIKSPDLLIDPARAFLADVDTGKE